MLRSTVQQRKAQASEIINAAKGLVKDEKSKKLFIEFNPFMDQLIRLCSYPPKEHAGASKMKSFSVATEFKMLKRMTQEPSGIILPLQRNLTAALPTNGKHSASYRPFENCPTICGFVDTVEILSSLQKPKVRGNCLVPP